MKRHTVHTKHPRYKVPNYPRGSGLGFKTGASGEIILSPNHKVLTQINQISSGTLGSISRKRTYDEIDDEREQFALHVANSYAYFQTWQEAWKHYERYIGRNTQRATQAQQTPSRVHYKGEIYTWSGSNYGYDHKENAEKTKEADKRFGKKSLIRTIMGTNDPVKGKKWYVVYSRPTAKSIDRLYSDQGARIRAKERAGIPTWDGKTDSASPYYALRQRGLSHKEAVSDLSR